MTKKRMKPKKTTRRRPARKIARKRRPVAPKHRRRGRGIIAEMVHDVETAADAVVDEMLTTFGSKKKGTMKKGGRK